MRYIFLFFMFSSVGLVSLASPPADQKKELDSLLKKLKEGSISERNEAVKALTHLGASAVPALVKILHSADEAARTRAILVLRKIGPEAKEAVPALQKIVRKHQGDAKIISIQAIQALGGIGPNAKDAVPTLIETLKTKKPMNPLRANAAIALGEIGPEAQAAVAALIDAVKESPEKSGPLRFHAATALGQIGPRAKAGVPALIELIEDEKAGPARMTAIEAVGRIGPDAKKALPALAKIANGSDAALREAAKKAQSQIKGEKP